MADEELTSVHSFKAKLASDLRRTNSSPISATHSDGDFALVKVLFPSLDCTKIFRLNPRHVSYEPLVKHLLALAKLDDEEKRGYRLYTSNGQIINPGDSLQESNLKDKDTLVFKREDYNPRRSLYPVGTSTPAGERRMSSAVEGADRKGPLSSSMSDLRAVQVAPGSSPACGPAAGTALSSPSHPSPSSPGVSTHGTPVATPDYWSSVSSFIGSFLKRRPPVTELPRHVLDLLGAPFVPRSHVVVACISYLRAKEAYAMEGIFRLSGLATEVQVVVDSFKQETFDLDWVRNPHTVATALKQYCRLASIIPEDMCSPWAHAMRENGCREDAGLLNSIVAGFSTLPTENRFILSCLFSFLQLVLDNHQSNKMAPHSLSVVWGPNLIHFHIPALDAFSEANIQASIMHIILSHLDKMSLLPD